MANNIVNDNNNNHTFYTAQNVTIDDIVYGKIAALSELDFYRVVFSGSGNIEFRLNIPANAKYRMWLLDEDINILDDVNGDIGERRSIIYNVQANTPYIIRIGASNSTDIEPDGYYNLQFIPEELINMTVVLSNSTIKPDLSSNYSISLNPANAYHKIDLTYNAGIVSVSSTNLSGNIFFKSNGNTVITFRDTISNISVSRNIESKAELTIWNFNKEYIGNDQCIKDAGCAVCCAADIVSFYNGSPISLRNLRDDYGVYNSGNATCHWDKMPECELYSPTTSIPLTTAGLCSAVKAQIDSGHPVLLHYTSQHNAQYGHWIVAYKYVYNCTNLNDVYICDPSFTKEGSTVHWAAGANYCNNVYNNGMTLQECINEGSVSSLQEIYFTRR